MRLKALCPHESPHTRLKALYAGESAIPKSRHAAPHPTTPSAYTRPAFGTRAPKGRPKCRETYFFMKCEMTSSGIGKSVVELFSVATSLSVCR